MGTIIIITLAGINIKMIILTSIAVFAAYYLHTGRNHKNDKLVKKYDNYIAIHSVVILLVVLAVFKFSRGLTMYDIEMNYTKPVIVLSFVVFLLEMLTEYRLVNKLDKRLKFLKNRR
ncbi:hypothetical protein D3C73_1417930 [compost metagenome]